MMNIAKQERTRNTDYTCMSSIPDFLLLLLRSLKNSHICLQMVGKETEIRCKDENKK